MNIRSESGKTNLAAIAVILGLVIAGVWVWKRLSIDTQEYVIDQAIPMAFAGEIVERQVERHKGQGTREGINTAQLKALELLLASVEEQRSIARILMTHTALCAEIQSQLVNLHRQKHGLTHDLLTGLVRVKVEGAANV